jgi:hypothetical protein
MALVSYTGKDSLVILPTASYYPGKKFHCGFFRNCQVEVDDDYARELLESAKPDSSIGRLLDKGELRVEFSSIKVPPVLSRKRTQKKVNGTDITD